MIRMLNQIHKNQGFTNHFEDPKDQNLEAQGEATGDVRLSGSFLTASDHLWGVNYMKSKQYQL